MENTLENKAKFFALYLDQEVFCINGWNRGAMICDAHKLIKEEFNYLKKSFIELKPLSLISDEDCKIVFYGKNKQEMFEYIGHGIMSLERVMFNFLKTLKPSSFDYLRSQGYALPWMGLSVEEQVNRGWVKLKGETK